MHLYGNYPFRFPHFAVTRTVRSVLLKTPLLQVEMHDVAAGPNAISVVKDRVSGANAQIMDLKALVVTRALFDGF